MINPIAIIDVDLTVVNSPKYWLHWLNSMAGTSYEIEEIGYAYNIGKHFEELLKPYRVHPSDFWRQSGAYDLMKPIEGTLEGLERIKDLGYDIVFTTFNKGFNSKSKHNFLRRNFGSVMDGYVVTKEKHFISSGTGRDIIVDDRNEFLLPNRAAFKFRMNTEWEQFQPNDANEILVNSMVEVAEYLESLKKAD
jgi:hypothetical protein